jgi:hypothetical protein
MDIEEDRKTGIMSRLWGGGLVHFNLETAVIAILTIMTYVNIRTSP